MIFNFYSLYSYCVITNNYKFRCLCELPNFKHCKCLLYITQVYLVKLEIIFYVFVFLTILINYRANDGLIIIIVTA